MAKTREQKLKDIHEISKVYEKAEGENDNITFDAWVDGHKVPVTTVKNNKMESHFVFEDDKPKATASEDTASENTASENTASEEDSNS